MIKRRTVQVDPPEATTPEHVGWFRQAITEDDNHTIDRTWLIVVHACFFVMPLVIISLVGVALLDVFKNQHEASVAGLGGGIAAVIAAIGAFIASCALILKQERAPQPPMSIRTESSTETVVK